MIVVVDPGVAIKWFVEEPLRPQARSLLANRHEVIAPDILIAGVAELAWKKTTSGEITVELKYHEGQPVIQEIARVSKPGRRVYSKISDLPRYYNGLGISILSTPRGVLSDSEARTQNVGGEVLCRVF